MDVAVSAGALAAAFAAIGLLATALFRLDSKMDAGFTRLDAKIDARFDRVDARLSAVEIKLASHLERHG